VEQADFILQLRHDQLIPASHLVETDGDFAQSHADASPDFLNVVTGAHQLQALKLILQILFMIRAVRGDPIREGRHRRCGAFQLLAEPRQLFAGSIPIFAKLPAKRSLHRMQALRALRFFPLMFDTLHVPPEFGELMRIDFHGILRDGANRERVTFTGGAIQIRHINVIQSVI
jgi:hypothetical protein